MAQLFTNNAVSTLAADITSVATTLTVATGHGARFPAITGSDFFIITLEKPDGTREIVKVTARSGDVLSGLIRAQEGTTAVAFVTGNAVELRVTAGVMSQIAQSSVNVIGAMQEITSVTTTGSQSSVTFDNIPSGYRDLLVVVRARSTEADVRDNILVRLNGDTGTNYRYRYWSPAGTAQAVSATSMLLGEASGTTAPASFQTSFEVSIPGYAESGTKTLMSRNAFIVGTGASDTTPATAMGMWGGAAAVSSVTLLFAVGNFVDGSVITLYGVGGTSVAQALSATPAAQIYAGAMREIATVTTTGSQATVVFSAIPGTYRDLLLVATARANGGGNSVNAYVRYNGDTGANYTWIRENRIASAGSTTGTYQELASFSAAGTADYNGTLNLWIRDYAVTGKYRPSIAQSSLVDVVTVVHQQAAGWWENTANAITSIEISLSAGTFLDGSTFTLYGIGGEVGGAALNPIYTKYDPFCPPLNPSSLNDEFDVEGSGTGAPPGWTSVGTLTPTWVTRLGYLDMTVPLNNSAQVGSIEKTLPAGPFTVAIATEHLASDAYNLAAVYVRSSVSGRMVRFALGRPVGATTMDPTLSAEKYTDLSTRSSVIDGGAFRTPRAFLRICYNGTNLYTQWSANGVQWVTKLIDEAVGTWFTGGNLPDRFGINMNSFSTFADARAAFDFVRYFPVANADIGRNIGVGSDGTVVSTLPLLLHNQVI